MAETKPEITIVERRRSSRKVAAQVAEACQRARRALRAALRRIDKANRILERVR